MRELFAQNQFNASLSNIEAYNALVATSTFPDILKLSIFEGTPPLWHLIERVLFLTLGTGEIAIRGLSFFLTLLTALFVYKIGNHIWGRKTGLTAFILTILNPIIFKYAFDGSTHMLLTLMITASMYFFLKRNYLLYIIFTILAIYSHQFAHLILIVQGIWIIYELIAKKRERVLKRIKSIILITLLTIPITWPMYLQLMNIHLNISQSTANPTDILTIFSHYLAKEIQLDSQFSLLTTYNLNTIALYLVIATLTLRHWHKSIKSTIFLLLWFLVPILTLWILYQNPDQMNTDYLLYTVPALALVLASKGQKYSGLVIGILIIVYGIIDFHYFVSPSKYDFKSMSTYINENIHDNGVVLNAYNKNVYPHHHLWESKYYGIEAPLLITNESIYSDVSQQPFIKEGDVVTNISDDEKRIYLITSNFSDVDYIPSAFIETKTYSTQNLNLIYYERMVMNETQSNL